MYVHQRKYFYVNDTFNVPFTKSESIFLGFTESDWDNAKRCRLRCDPQTGEKETIDAFVEKYGGTLGDPPLEWERAFEPKRNSDGKRHRFTPVVGWARKNGISHVIHFLFTKGFREIVDLGTLSREDIYENNEFDASTKARFFHAIKRQRRSLGSI